MVDYNQYGGMQPVQEEVSWLDRIKSAGKWVLGIGTSLFAVFSFSDKARGSADDLTGGLATKFTEGVTGLFRDGKNAIAEKFNIEPSKDDVVERKKVGDVEIILPTSTLSRSDIVKNPDGSSLLLNIKEAREEFKPSALMKEDEREKGLKNIDDKRKQAMRFAIIADEIWNPEVRRYNSTSREHGSDFPSPSEINLDLSKISISEDLRSFAISKIGSEKWEKLTTLRKVQWLETNIDDATSKVNKPDFGKYTLSKRSVSEKDVDSYVSDTRWLAVTALPDAVLNVFPDSVSKYLGKDEREEISRKMEIRGLIENGKLNEALVKTNAAHEHFTNSAAKLNVNNTDTGALYRKLIGDKDNIGDFKEIANYIEALKVKSQFEEVSNKFYSSVITTAKNANNTFDELEIKAQQYAKSNGSSLQPVTPAPVVPPTANPPAPAAPTTDAPEPVVKQNNGEPKAVVDAGAGRGTGETVVDRKIASIFSGNPLDEFSSGAGKTPSAQAVAKNPVVNLDEYGEMAIQSIRDVATKAQIDGAAPEKLAILGASSHIGYPPNQDKGKAELRNK